MAYLQRVHHMNKAKMKQLNWSLRKNVKLDNRGELKWSYCMKIENRETQVGLDNSTYVKLI